MPDPRAPDGYREVPLSSKQDRDAHVRELSDAFEPDTDVPF
jgi:hypothetical protein